WSEVERQSLHVADGSFRAPRQRLVERGCGDGETIRRIARRQRAIPSATVIEKLANRDLFPARVDGSARLGFEVRDERRNVFVERELAILDECPDGGTRDRLGDAGDAELRVRLHECLVLDI